MNMRRFRNKPSKRALVRMVTKSAETMPELPSRLSPSGAAAGAAIAVTTTSDTKPACNNFSVPLLVSFDHFGI